jgi:hypothetical protein
MIKRINFKIYFYLFICLFVSTNLFSQEAKWIQIGALHGWFAENGSEKEEGIAVNRQQNGLRWPAFYDDQDCQAAKALWIGTTNFTDENGASYPAKVVAVGPRHWGPGEFFPKLFTMSTRFSAPSVIVDGALGTSIPDYVDGDTDPDLIADRVLTNIVGTSIGIDMTRKVYAFAHQFHDNYFIYEYEFKNTGDVNGDGVPELNKTLENVYFYFHHRYSVGREGCVFPETGDGTQWGMNALWETLGDDENSTDPFRAIWTSHGRFSDAKHDNIGAPNTTASSSYFLYARGDGHLGAAQYCGWLTIHADKSATDKSDDKNQPRTVSYEDSDDPLTMCTDFIDQYDLGKMEKRYELMTKGYVRPRHVDLVGDKAVDAAGPPAGFFGAIGYGPYRLEIGQSVKIVVAEAVAGLNREQCYKIGGDWLAARCTYPGVIGNDAAKNAWVRTGKDSLYETFRRATENWNSGLKLAQPPDPPRFFEVNSGGDRISLSWSNSSESDPTLKGYKIYRADSVWDNYMYKLIAEVPKGVLSYDDRTPVRGYSYYYYLEAVGDGSNNGGIELVSNRQATQTYDPAYLMRPAEDDMSNIVVVPNPFNIKARSLQYKGENDKLMFLDIPPVCTIKIYTERGDLIKTIYHTNGSGDEAWHSNTEFRQIVVSGLYIAYFETPDGRTTYRKFVVIR